MSTDWISVVGVMADLEVPVDTSTRGHCLRVVIARLYACGSGRDVVSVASAVSELGSSLMFTGSDDGVHDMVTGEVVGVRVTVYGEDHPSNHVELVDASADSVGSAEAKEIDTGTGRAREWLVYPHQFIAPGSPWYDVVFYLMDPDAAMDAIDRYHQYLEENYTGGVQRFFSPTGFLKDFQVNVTLSSQRERQQVYAASVDDAVRRLEPVVNGQEGVFDLVAEPGTGKTSVLPFRFGSRQVVVAVPTPFDAWSAYQVATGDCRLVLKGLRLGPAGATVCYTDSYMAADAVMSGSMEFDIMIVDECNSGKGITSFLAEVKVPGKSLLRMSGSLGRGRQLATRAHQVVESAGMPDIRTGMHELAKYVVDKASGRTMVLVPDADTASSLAAHVPGARLITSASPLRDMAVAMLNQRDDCLYIADDVCARGTNLNLDAVFDTQLVAEHGLVRVVTPEEAMQRRERVGRNKRGHYHHCGLVPVEKAANAIDVVRNNVARAKAGVPQEGCADGWVGRAELGGLLCAATEPFLLRAQLARPDQFVPDPGLPPITPRTPSRARTERSSSGSSSGHSVEPPPWLAYFSGVGVSGGSIGVDYRKSGRVLVRRRASSGSVDRGRPAGFGTLSRPHAAEPLPQAVEHAPYAATSCPRRPVDVLVQAVPVAPPVVDLTQTTYELDWPALVRDRFLSGGDLPTLVPPASWRHTASGGMSTDWLRRLDDLAVRDNEFTEKELEIVCRAWNRIVALEWVRRTPGLSNTENEYRAGYCVRYFQAYYQLVAAA